MSKQANSVFINCPFDERYKPLFHSLVFCVFDCGFLPRSSLEESDSSEVRFSKIMRLVQTCEYGIHDISRTELDDTNQLPRFNMPFELGLFLGCRYSAQKDQATKQYLILDREPHRYQEFLSDIAGQDIQSHANSPTKAIQCVRDWLRTASKRSGIPGGDEIVRRYKQFEKDLPAICDDLKLSPSASKLIFADLCLVISRWLKLEPILRKARVRR